jgi:hypothetical protein
MADPYCAANRPLRVENCWPMEIEPKSEISMKPSVAQQVAEVARMGGQIWLAPGVLGTLLGRKVEVAGYAIGVGLQGGKAVLAFVAPHQRFGERFERAVISRAPSRLRLGSPSTRPLRGLDHLDKRRQRGRG